MSGKVLVHVDPKYYCLTEVDLLLRNAFKAKEKLGWSHVYSLDQLIEEMIHGDISLLEKNDGRMKPFWTI